MIDYISSRPFAYTQSGPDGIGGAGNYELDVTGSDAKAVFRMYFLDTGTKGALSKGQNDYMRTLAASHASDNATAIIVLPHPNSRVHPWPQWTRSRTATKAKRSPTGRSQVSSTPSLRVLHTDRIVILSYSMVL